MSLPELVIFDCDGVLVDTESVTSQVIVDNLARHGLEITLADCMAMFVGGTISAVGVKAREMGALIPDSWVDDLYAEMYATLRKDVDAVPGITGVLDALDQVGLPYCVASNGSPEKMAITLGATGLLPRLEGRLFSAHEVGIAKPEPGLFLHAARTLGATPSKCVVIEDSPSGARAAFAAKMRCFGYAADTPAERLQTEGAEVFTDMAALPGLIGLEQN